MCPERDASALSGFIPPWERQCFNTHSFRQQNSELCAGAALRGTTRTAGTCLRLLSNGGGGGAHCDRSCGNGISLKHKTWSLSPSVQSVSVMKATLLVLLLSAVAVMLSCDHQHSEREAGPGCPLGKRLAFDVNTTIEESKRLNNEYFDCPNPEPGAPCFYYSHVRALFFHQMTMTVVQTILICYIGHTCWRLKRKTVYTKTRDGLDEQEGHEQFNAGDVGVNVGCTLRSCCLHLYHIIFGIVQNPVLDHVILLVVLLDTSTLMAHTFQSVTVTTSWCLSAVNSCLLVFYVLEALLKILIQGRTYFRNPWNDLDFFILLMTLLDFVLSLVQSGGGFSSRQASTLFRVFKTLKGARVFRALRLLKAIRFFKGLQDILLTCLQSFRLFIAVLVDNFQLSIRKKRHHKSQKSPDVKEGEAQSTKKAGEDLDVSLAEIEEEFYKEALRHASSDGKHSKRKIELTKRYLQLLAAMDQHAQKYRSQACLLDKLVETFFMDQDEETRSDAVE
ncbi:hypothetical protein SRHO_G00341520 [Serrasalmus rhombeus]